MWGRDEKIDKIVRERISQLLAHMLTNGELNEYDVNRINKRLDQLYPLPISNSRIIDLISLLQQREGEKDEEHRNPMTSTIRLRPSE